jgi:hypothetical protein
LARLQYENIEHYFKTIAIATSNASNKDV